MARKVLSQEQKDQIYYVYYNLNFEAKTIADFYDIHPLTVMNIMRQMNCPGKKTAEYKKVKEEAQKHRKDIYEDYKKSGIKYPATYCKKTNAPFNALVLSCIITEFGNLEIIDDKEEAIVEEPVITEELQIKNDDIKKVNTDNHVYCTFFMDRHDFPDHVNKSIYSTKSLDSYRMFDMDFLYKKSVEFIESNITFDKDGNAESDIVVYMSGLQAVAGAIVRACIESHVNLTFMHYNKATDEWYKQTVIDCYKSGSTLLSQCVDWINSMPHKYDDLYICGDVDLENPFYIVKICYSDENSIVYNSQGYICSDGWERFGKFGEQMLSVPIRTKVLLLQVTRDETNRYGFRIKGPHRAKLQHAEDQL